MHNFSILNRLMIQLDTNFFSYPYEVQERKRSLLISEHGDEIKKFIAKEVFGIECKLPWMVDLVYEDMFEDSGVEAADIHNQYQTQLTGIGKNKICLIGYLDADESLMDYESIYEFDKQFFEYNQKMMLRDFPNIYKDKPYQAFLPGVRGRFFIGDCFYYANIESLSGHVISYLSDAHDSLIDALIPNEAIPSTNNGKEQDGHVVWSIKIDAYGLDFVLKELQKEGINYLAKREEYLDEVFSKMGPLAFVVEDSMYYPEKHVSLIYNNADALKKVSWKNIVEDTAIITESDSDILTDLLAGEIVLAEKFIKDKHRELMNNFNPNIISLPIEKEILFRGSAFDIIDTE